MKQAVAYANANIALVKYWGKNDGAYNIPAVSSLSMTLNDMGTNVTLQSSKLSCHGVFIEDIPAPEGVGLRVANYLEQVRKLFSYDGFLHVFSTSSVPMASGLASSAAFYAALATAIDGMFDLKLDAYGRSKLARLGSGSAARSIFSHFAGLHGGLGLNHDDAFAFPVEPSPHLDLAMIIVMVDTKQKPWSSTEAMKLTKNTSPFFKAFVDASASDNKKAISALKNGSLSTLGEIMEHSTLKMFATMWSSTPFINYWQPNTLLVIDLVVTLRKIHGPVVYFTLDAGPNVKILCSSTFVPIVVKALKESGILSTFRIIKPGAGAQIMAVKTS